MNHLRHVDIKEDSCHALPWRLESNAAESLLHAPEVKRTRLRKFGHYQSVWYDFSYVEMRYLDLYFAFALVYSSPKLCE